MACCLICGPELWSYSHSDNAAHRAYVAAEDEVVAAPDAVELLLALGLAPRDGALPAMGDTAVV